MGSSVTRLFILLGVILALGGILAGPLAMAAEPSKDAPRPPAKTDKVHPAKYRILVKYDKYTSDMVRREIEQEVTKALEARRRRLKLSEEQAKVQLRRELRRFEEELEAIRKARREEEAARRRGDDAEAERWRRLRLERTRRALDLARRTRLIENALLAMSLADWRTAIRKERMIAGKALARLEALLAEVRARREAEARERGPTGLAPPHK